MKKLLLSFAFVGASIASFAQLTSLTVGQTAPNFTVTDLHGDTHTLSDYTGKYVVVDFFAYWCGPCAAVAPTINAFYKKYGCNAYDVVVLGIEYEGTIAQTQAFEDANGGDANFPTPTVAGQNTGGAVHTAYSPAAYPTIILIGPDGLIKNTDIWPIPTVAALETAITSAGGASSLVVNNCSLSLDDVSLFEGISVFPNPTNGTSNLEFNSSKSGDLKIEIIDLNGQIVSTSISTVNSGDNLINVNSEELVSGSYIVKLSMNNEEKRISFVKI